MSSSYSNRGSCSYSSRISSLVSMPISAASRAPHTLGDRVVEDPQVEALHLFREGPIPLSVERVAERCGHRVCGEQSEDDGLEPGQPCCAISTLRKTGQGPWPTRWQNWRAAPQ
jgi:hypothetical protein